MSRSYKKCPYYGPKDKDYKKISNRKVRRRDDIPDGNAYRKVLDPWDICDHSTVVTWKDEVRRTERYLRRYEETGHRWYIYRMLDENGDVDWKTIYRKWYTNYKTK